MRDDVKAIHDLHGLLKDVRRELLTTMRLIQGRQDIHPIGEAYKHADEADRLIYLAILRTERQAKS